MATPRSLRLALDQITANLIAPEAVAAPEMVAAAFSPAADRQLQRTQSIFDSDNVIGAGIAEKISDEGATGELGITIYVKEKIPLKELRPQDVVPPVLAGPQGKAIFTDVIAIGEVVPEAPNTSPPPLRTGFSVCHFQGTAGTLGAFVRKRSKVFILSNSHVLAQAGTAAVGDNILFPGPADGGVNPAARCGQLAAFTPFVVGGTFTNLADAAIAAVAPGLLSTINETIPKAAKPLRVATPTRGMRVVKRGRTTNDTESVVRDTDFRIQVNYPGVGVVGFTGQVKCDRYTGPGDSGSIVVDKASGAIVGLHFAGSSESSVFTPIRAVMAALGIRF